MMKEIIEFQDRKYKEFIDKQNSVLIERLDLLGINLDLEEEKIRRFPSLLVEKFENTHTYYYNDGSVEGLKIVTFKMGINFDLEYE